MIAEPRLEDSPTPVPERGLTWHKLLFLCLAGISASFALLMAVFRFFEPPLAVFVIVFAVAALIVRIRRRGAVISALVLSVVFLVMNIPFLAPTLSQPASIPDFLPAVLVLIFTVVAIFSATMIVRHREEPSGPRAATRIAIAVFGLAVVFSTVSSITFEQAVAQEGDLRVVTRAVQFQDESLKANSGTVAVFVDNKDQTLHTFTIDELDAELQVPAGSKARFEFEAEPGEYTFYCVPHATTMEGTLVVK